MIYLLHIYRCLKKFFKFPNQFISSLRTDIRKDFLSKKLKPGLNVLVIGLPKSGTTMIEEILSEIGFVNQANSILRLFDDRGLSHHHDLSRKMLNKIEVMSKERVDLEEAIAKLRSGIFELNKEGRQRLKESFEEVNKNFKQLFQKLFGGGNAELRLVGNEDPLQAGLEVLASPPGKKMQLLSLLSGGEQALTAISLIFSVFLCNPAPICILDEVDAPLDDTNVGRFCDLLNQIVDETNTYFMVITHHRLTMAKMDRLFGVTMEQKGISKLVSVDLEQASRIRDIA